LKRNNHGTIDGSFATSDLFERHPKNHDKWKYIGRVDDIIVLANGENFNPVPAENAIGRSPAVHHVIICGTGRDQSGLLVFPKSDEPQFTGNDKAVLPELWPFIEEANSQLPSFARLTPDAVIVIPANTKYAVTDKGTAIRKAILRQFSDAIEALYQRLAGSETDPSSGLKLSIFEMKAYIRDSVALMLQLVPSSQLTDEADFFAHGLDSIMAMELWRKFSQDLNTGGKKIMQNIAFEKPNVAQLSQYLHDLRFSSTHDMQIPLVPMRYMETLISRYSSFDELRSSQTSSSDLPYGEFIVRILT
jgi:aryl carrier-like protein